MFRWNGWGDDKTHMPLPAGAAPMLEALAGRPSAPGISSKMEDILSKIPETRIRRPLSIVSTEPSDRLLHSYGQSMPDWIGFKYGTLDSFPDGVCFPGTAEELKQALDFASKENLLVIPYGGGTSVAGHLSVPGSDRPVLSVSMERLNRLVDISPESRLATFEAGVRGPYLEAQLKTHGYTLGHYPQSFERSTLGGWIATRSSGQQSLYYGRIEDLFAGGGLVTPKGEMFFPPFPASAAGPDLRHIMLGSEGRMGILFSAQVRITEIPEQDPVYGVFFPSWQKAVECVRCLAGSDIRLSMIRLSNPSETMTNLVLAGHEKQISMLKTYLRIRGFSESRCCMALIGVTGGRKAVRTGWKHARSILRKYGAVNLGRLMGDSWKKNRFLAPYLRNTLWDLGYAVDTMETAVTWDRVTPSMDAIEDAVSGALSGMGEKVHVFSHLSHVYGTGSSIYTTCVFRLADSAEETMERWRLIKQSASRATVEAGGTISHQHGVGTDHKQYLEAEKGEAGIRLLNSIWNSADPERIMNPGKLT